jgi:hypothetical protein
LFELYEIYQVVNMMKKNIWYTFLIFVMTSFQLCLAQPGGLPGGGIPNFGTLINALNQTTTTLGNATTSINQLNQTAGQINQTAAGINQTAGAINQTANRAIDTYEQQMSPQIDRALALGEETNQTIRDALKPENLFIAGLATAAGGALGGFLMNAAITGVEAIVKLITTDWDQVALDIFEANIHALYEAQQRLDKLTHVHAQLAKTYQIMQLPAFQALKSMDQEERKQELRQHAHDAFCRGELKPEQIEVIMQFGEHLDRFSSNEGQLHAQLCQYKTMMDNTRLTIIQRASDAQAAFGKGIYALRENVYASLERASEERKKYLETKDLRLQKNKADQLNCIRKDTGTPSMIERWNSKYCGYDGPEMCLTMRQWNKRSPKTDRINETYNCIWECVPPEQQDITNLNCPVKVGIPIFGILSGPKKDCADLRDSIKRKLNVDCQEFATYFPVLKQEIEREIDLLPGLLRNQKRGVDLRIRTMEHAVQQMLAPQETNTLSEDRQRYHDFLNSVCR